MFTTLQIEMATAVSNLIYGEEGFEQYEVKEVTEYAPCVFKRCTIKMPSNEDYGNGCALITRKIDNQWYIGITNIWFDENTECEKFNVINYMLVHDQELKYKSTLMLKVLKWVDKIIGDDPVYNLENE